MTPEQFARDYIAEVIQIPPGLEDTGIPERIARRWESEAGERRPWPQAASDVDPSTALDDDFVVDGVLRHGRLLVIAAAEGIGKSRVRAELGMRLATGHGALFDHYPIPARCRVLTIDVENGDEEEIRREEETRERLGLERSQLVDYYRVSLDGLSLTDAEDQSYVLSAVGQVRPSVVIFDTGSSMVGDEWGDPLKAAIRFLRLVARTYHTAIVVCVHLTKPSRAGKATKEPAQHGTELSDVMGQWTRQADSVALMADAGADRIRWTMRKRVPPSTLVLERSEGTFHAVQVIGGEDLGLPLRRRILNVIAAGETDAKVIASYVGVAERTVWRHIRALRKTGDVEREAPLRVSVPVSRPVSGLDAA